MKIFAIIALIALAKGLHVEVEVPEKAYPHPIDHDDYDLDDIDFENGVPNGLLDHVSCNFVCDLLPFPFGLPCKVWFCHEYAWVQDVKDLLKWLFQVGEPTMCSRGCKFLPFPFSLACRMLICEGSEDLADPAKAYPPQLS